jgi:hypothetical protein
MSGIYKWIFGKPKSPASSKSSSKSPASSKSPNSNSKSPRSKYAEKMYVNTMLGTIPKSIDPKSIDEVNRVFLMHGVTDQIYKNYKNSLKYLVDGISLDNLNLEYLALNPRLPNSFIKDIIKLIGDDKKSLKQFYHNLAKNKNPKVFSILRKEYRDNPDSDKLEWKALSRNPNAISILKKEYELNPNRIDFNSLSSNTHRDAIKLLERRIVVENKYLPNVYAKVKSWDKIIDWCSLSANPNAIKLIREEYERDPVSNRINFTELSKHPQISKLTDILIEEANFNKLYIIYLESNPFAPVELLKNINRNFVFKAADNPNLYVINLMKEEYEKEHSTRNIKWYPLSESTIPEAIKLLRDIIKYEIKENETRPLYKRKSITSIYGSFIDFTRLSANPTDEAISLLNEYVDIELGSTSSKSNVDWDALSSNPHPVAIELLRNKIARERKEVYDVNLQEPYIGKDRINWGNIAANIGAIELIKEKLIKESPDAIFGRISTYDKIYKLDKNKLSTNPAIFVDYDILTRKSATKK